MAKARKGKPNALPFSNNLDSDQGTIYLRIIWMIIRD